MSAQPAWPEKSLVRTYIKQPIISGKETIIDGQSAHHLIHVLRKKVGDNIEIFDGKNGSYRAVITHINRDMLQCMVKEQLRPTGQISDIWLCAALIKKHRFEWMVQKASELGVNKIIPLHTRRVANSSYNISRYEAQIIAAAEQCGRNQLPDLTQVEKLDALLKAWPNDRLLYFANEQLSREQAPSESIISSPVKWAGQSNILEIFQHNIAKPSALLIGPEGGFSKEEVDLITSHPQTISVGLGPHILRAETAAIAALTLWMATNIWNK